MPSLRKLLQLVTLMFGKPPLKLDLAPEADYRHALAPGEHEALYFLFTSPDGAVTGGLRLLLGHSDILEMVGLRFGDHGWVHQRRVPHTPNEADPTRITGPTLELACLAPWQRWHAHFADPAQTPGGHAETLRLDLDFRATTPPASFRIGEYEQAQQDGRLTGRIETPHGHWDGELISYRDHSWGRRGAGEIPGWMILDIPEHLYAFIIGSVERPLFGVGRIVTADGTLKNVRRPRIRRLSPDRWQVQDRRAGFEPWTFERLVPAGVSYLGGAGQEAVREQATTGDRFVDRIGPAQFTSPTGETVVGFWDEARRLTS